MYENNLSAHLRSKGVPIGMVRKLYLQQNTVLVSVYLLVFRVLKAAIEGTKQICQEADHLNLLKE